MNIPKARNYFIDLINEDLDDILLIIAHPKYNSTDLHTRINEFVRSIKDKIEILKDD